MKSNSTTDYKQYFVQEEQTINGCSIVYCWYSPTQVSTLWPVDQRMVFKIANQQWIDQLLEIFALSLLRQIGEEQPCSTVDIN